MPANATKAAKAIRPEPTHHPIEKITPPLWERIKANPRYAPELLATAAVDTLGRQAAGYTRWLTATYPHATPDAIARYAVQRHTKRAGYAALATVAGRPWGSLASVAALTWAQARLVLLIAAAYGHDPADPQRVPELLVLLGVHPDMSTAKAALDAAADPARHAPYGWAGLARSVAPPVGRRLLPGAGLLLGALVNSARTEAVARRAIGRYSQET